MNMSITLDDTVSEKLHTEAAALQLSAEEFAAQLLTEAMGCRSETTGQPRHPNVRRWMLIRKSSRTGLTNEETEELNKLQAKARHQVNGFDESRMERIEQMKKEVEEALNPEAD